MGSIQTDHVSAQHNAQDAMLAGLTLHWHTDIEDIPAKGWDALCANAEGAHPFLRHGFMAAMVHSGSATPETGWHVLFLTIQNESGELLAGCPSFVKTHSYGEYVFDWAWGDAHDNALAPQQTYYPKLLSASPFSPIPGQRLLTRSDLPPSLQSALRRMLLQALEARCVAQGWSSVHVLFLSEQEAAEAQPMGWLRRQGVQFHWLNRQPNPYLDFDDFLQSLQRDKRKKIQQERRKVSAQGIQFVTKTGAEIQAADWDFFHRCYQQTYLDRGREPYLTREFWQLASNALPDNWVLFTAQRNGEPIACALLAIDPVHRIAYGRYWGAIENVAFLHFEACYYQPLAWCIANGYRRFEGGAQGEHKLARGLEATPTQSVHWLQHEGLKQAVGRFLMREAHGMSQYMEVLDARAPFKTTGSASTQKTTTKD